MFLSSNLGWQVAGFDKKTWEQVILFVRLRVVVLGVVQHHEEISFAATSPSLAKTACCSNSYSRPATEGWSNAVRTIAFGVSVDFPTCSPISIPFVCSSWLFFSLCLSISVVCSPIISRRALGWLFPTPARATQASGAAPTCWGDCLTRAREQVAKQETAGAPLLRTRNERKGDIAAWLRSAARKNQGRCQCCVLVPGVGAPRRSSRKARRRRADEEEDRKCDGYGEGSDSHTTGI